MDDAGIDHGICAGAAIPDRAPQPLGKLAEFRNASTGIVLTLIERAEADPGLGDRADVLALLLRSRRDGGTGMPRLDICDETVGHRCGPRKHGVSAGLGVRAVAAPPRRAGRTGQRGR